MYIEQLYTNCLAEAAYYIESDGESAIIDPLRETEPYIELANKRGTKIKYVFETHFHADFVSGHLDLSREVDAPIIYGPGANTNYKIYQAKDGEEFKLGKIKIRALHTPGHTPESTCYLLFDEEGKANAIFTGDTLFVGDVGRPDLLDGEITPEALASMMYDSLNSKIKPLPDHVTVYPAHGPGSACGKNIGKETFSTIGEQKSFNYALKDMGREDFIKSVIDGILPPPQYFYDDARINRMGYSPLEDVIRKNSNPLSARAFQDIVQQGAVILDTRKADDFEKGHIPGSINIGLNGQFAVWVGTLLNMNEPLVLVTEKGKEEESVLRLARVGYEMVKGYLQGGITEWSGELDTVKSIHANKLTDYIKDDATILDVRKPGEWNVSHIEGATLFPLSNFPGNLSALDKSKLYVVHCAGGYRSMTAISIMQKVGFKNLINIYGGFGAMQQAGLSLATGEVMPEHST